MRLPICRRTIATPADLAAPAVTTVAATGRPSCHVSEISRRNHLFRSRRAMALRW